MKRYWKTITLCLVSLIVIVSFYIQTSLAQVKTNVQFETISGNQKEIERISLYANYGEGNYFTTLRVTDKETVTLNNGGLTQEFNMVKHDPLYRLIKDHKSFMRGKVLFGNYLYEDQDLLVYANATKASAFDDEMKMEIEVLDKKENKRTSTEWALKGENWVDVVDVQVYGDELKIITRNFDAQGGSELFIYSLELDGLNEKGHESIVSAPVVENGWSDIQIINSTNAIQSERFLLVKINKGTEEEAVEDGQALVENNQIMLYDMQENQSKSITVPESVAIDSASISESTIYFASQSDRGLEITPYDIEKEEWGKVLSFDFMQGKGSDVYSHFKLMNGKVYQFSSGEKESFMSVGSLTTGKTLYEGRLKITNSDSEEKGNGRLDVYEIEYIE